MNQSSPSSYLPEPVIQSILKLLSPKYAIRASLTSKLWRSAWITSPVFEFEEKSLPFKQADFYDYARRCLAVWSDHCDDRVNMEKLSVYSDVGTDGTFFPRFVELVSIATNRNVKIIELHNCSEDYHSHTILSTDSLWSLISDCKSLDVLSLKSFQLSLAITLPVFSSVKKLELSVVGIDNSSLRYLLSCLPLLEEFVVGFCFDFTELRVSSPKLKSMELSICDDDIPQNVFIDSVNLQSFTYTKAFNAQGLLRFSNCKLLKTLQIERTKISTGNAFDEYLSQIPFLENLKLKSCQINEGVTVQISHSNLKSLVVSGCFRLCKVECNTPNLRYFKYSGGILKLFKFKYCSGLLNAKLELYTGSFDGTEWFWFIRLRNFLEIFRDCEVLSMAVHLEGFPEELRNYDMLPDPFYELKHLKITNSMFPISQQANFFNAFVELFPCVETFSLKAFDCELTIKYDEDRDFNLSWIPFIRASTSDEYDKNFEEMKECIDTIVNLLSWTEENYSEEENCADEYSEMDVSSFGV
ncbi:F-box/FBD/LRR-repeat protein At5g53840 isoform X1 [Cannabis sativa]|uniref:F-box/FBD/LRR-repeat protein At5g53840 isoform X1 n=1 Tax=Cannabis sativa TaxID=3483 RepID=UPI0011E05137|nr:F-box/FBD/LRR-repeat protein At5g53840 isoform X1 [Cannabis sativa]